MSENNQIKKSVKMDKEGIQEKNLRQDDNDDLDDLDQFSEELDDS